MEGGGASVENFIIYYLEVYSALRCTLLQLYGLHCIPYPSIVLTFCLPCRVFVVVLRTATV